MLREVAQAAFPGIDCIEASDVRSAHALCDHALELALVDLSLPDGSGIEVIRKLKASQHDCMIIVVTIFDDDDHLFPALRAGAQGYLLKDEPPERLIRQLLVIRNGQPPLSPAIARRILDYFWRQDVGVDVDANSLTAREREVLSLIARGFSATESARLLGLSRHTIGDHIKNIYRKLAITTRAEAALRAKELGLI